MAMQHLGRVCRAYGITPSRYVQEHDLEDLHFDLMVTAEWERVAADEALDVARRSVNQLPQKSAEAAQGVLLTCLVRTSSR